MTIIIFIASHKLLCQAVEQPPLAFSVHSQDPSFVPLHRLLSSRPAPGTGSVGTHSMESRVPGDGGVA